MSDDTVILRLPRLGGTREDADQLLVSHGLPGSAPEGATVVIVGADVLAASTSFADQLIKRLLDERRDLSVALVAPPEKLHTYLVSAQRRRGIDESRLTTGSAVDLGV